jgi:hypothetical protein
MKSAGRESGTVWNRRTRDGLIAAASLLVFQIYAARELLAAELLLAMVFVFLGALGAVLYFIGSLAERGAMTAEALLRSVAPRVRHGWRDLELIGRRWLGPAGALHARR